MERFVELENGKKIKFKEPMKIRREYFRPWEYWALKEHMAMKRCDTWEEYIIEILMATKMPSRERATTPEIEERPGVDEPRRAIIIKIPLKKLEFVDERRRRLLRSWREFMLYPAVIENLVADHYHEITGGKWPLEKIIDG